MRHEWTNDVDAMANRKRCTGYAGMAITRGYSHSH